MGFPHFKERTIHSVLTELQAAYDTMIAIHHLRRFELNIGLTSAMWHFAFQTRNQEKIN
jgi:hypothetical protein